MSTEIQKKIMISYGHGDATDFVLDINNVLTKEGHSVWIDRSLQKESGIHAGTAWEEAIETAIESHDIVIAVLTPHAIRRSKGVCLDEISMARFENKLIIPIMYKYVKPPLCIFRLDWIDFIKSDQKSVIESGYSKLIKSINENKIAYEGKNTQFSVLKSINFDSRLTALKKDFVGREWIFNEKSPESDSLMNDWLVKDDSPIMMIMGHPGIGKSAISAYLIEKHPACIAYHFCLAEDEETLNPNKFIKSIAHQLTSQLGDEYSDQILEEISDLPTSSVSLFRVLIANPISQMKDNKESCFIVVDGLDEASRKNSTNELLKLFSSKFIDALPKHIRFVFTSRDDNNITSRFEVYKPFKLKTTDTRNIDDMRSYINLMLKKYSIKTLTETEVETLIKKSEGSILYLQQVIKKVKIATKKEISVDNLPNGLYGIYSEYFDNTFIDNRDDYKVSREILSVLVALYVPIAKNFLEILLDKEHIEMGRLETYFPTDSNGRLSVFHKSFIDWLIVDKIYSVDEHEGHMKIVECEKINKEDQEELRIYFYSAVKVLVRKKSKRDEDVEYFFETKINRYLTKLQNTNENHVLISKLKKLIEIDVDLYKLYSNSFESLFVEDKNEKSIAELEKRYKQDKEIWAEDYIEALHETSKSYMKENRFYEAARSGELSLETIEELYEDNSLQWAETYTLALSNLASLYKNQNRLDDAIALEERSLKIREALYEANPAQWAENYSEALSNLAYSYRNQKRLDKATALEEKSFVIRKALYEANPAQGADAYTTALSSLASSYYSYYRLDEAIALEEESLKIRKALYEANPEQWAERYFGTLNKMALYYKNQNRFEDVIPFEEHSSKVLENLYKDNPERWAEDYTTALNNLAYSYNVQKREDEALELGNKSLKILWEHYIRNPSRWAELYAKALNHLSSMYKTQDNIDKAITLMEQSLNLTQALYIANPLRLKVDYISALSAMAVLYQKQDRLEESIRLEKKSLEIIQTLYQENASQWVKNYIIALKNLAISFYKKKNIEESLKLFTTQYEVYKKHYGDKDNRTLKVLQNIEHIRGAV